MAEVTKILVAGQTIEIEGKQTPQKIFNAAKKAGIDSLEVAKFLVERLSGVVAPSNPKEAFSTILETVENETDVYTDLQKRLNAFMNQNKDILSSHKEMVDKIRASAAVLRDLKPQEMAALETENGIEFSAIKYGSGKSVAARSRVDILSSLQEMAGIKS